MEEDFDFDSGDSSEPRNSNGNDGHTTPVPIGKPTRDNLKKLLAYAEEIQKRYESEYGEEKLIIELRDCSERLVKVFLEKNPDPKIAERARYLNDVIQGRKTEFE